MLAVIKEVFFLLNTKQKKKFLVLQCLVITMSFSELMGVASIGPFMTLIGNPDIINNPNHFLGILYLHSGNNDPFTFMIQLGLLSLAILLTSATISIYTTWKLINFAQTTGTELGGRLYHYFMHKNWLFHTTSTTANLIKKIQGDTNKFTSHILEPILFMNAKITLMLFLALPIVIFNPSIAFIGLTLFSAAYLILFWIVKHIIRHNAELIDKATVNRYTSLTEGFGAIKDTLLHGKQKSYIARFDQDGKILSRGNSINITLGIIPKSIMDVFAFTALISLILFLFQSYEGDLGVILPTVAIYALAGFKLLPCFQQIYSSVTNIKAGIPTFYAIRNDLLSSLENPNSLNKITTQLTPKNSIKISDATFTYPGKSDPTLHNLNIEIPVNKKIGIVGSTGSGKSTTIDLILGLVKPESGQLFVDEIPITDHNLREWQNSLGYVPQSIFLSNKSILENIAFGDPRETIDIPKVREAIRLANLEEFINELPDGIDTYVGERGIQLSGGQRQRIGIARSLYNNVKVLILDEATSALDGITERYLMQAINDLSADKTIIIIAHRFTTIERCDMIYMIEHGTVSDKGSYQELMERNSKFRKMATSQ